MTQLVNEFKFFSFRKKALAVLLLVAVIFTAASMFYSASAAVDPNTSIFASKASYDTSHRGHAPEPSSLALMGSGILAAIVRFARRRFAEFKRGFDIVVSAAGLIVSFPVLLLSIFVIKITSPGP